MHECKCAIYASDQKLQWCNSNRVHRYPDENTWAKINYIGNRWRSWAVACRNKSSNLANHQPISLLQVHRLVGSDSVELSCVYSVWCHPEFRKVSGYVRLSWLLIKPLLILTTQNANKSLQAKHSSFESTYLRNWSSLCAPQYYLIRIPLVYIPQTPETRRYPYTCFRNNKFAKS